MNIAQRVSQALVASGVEERLTGYSAEPRLSENALTVLHRRYLAKDRQGRVIESPKEMFQRVAKDLSLAELRYHQLGETEADLRRRSEQRAEEFYEVMSHLLFLPNSPTLMNAGRELQQLSGCYVLPVGDSLKEIFGAVTLGALVHQSGGGTGFSLSRIRPAGDFVGSTGGIASGPVSFLRCFDTTTDVVKQGGTRRGANMAVLRVDHPDILEFITAKRDGTRFQNFNISVAATDAFMKSLHSPSEKGAEFPLVNPRDGSVVGTAAAPQVFELIVQLAWETGDPGLWFIDRVNQSHPNQHLGLIETCNPCGEQELLPYESCNLGSLNLARLLKYTDQGAVLNMGLLGEVVGIGVRLLDNVIDRNRYPSPEIEQATKQTRRIGFGVMGWAEYLIQRGLSYDTPEALAEAKAVMGLIQRLVYEASHSLARERGCYPAFEGSEYAKRGYEMRNTAPVTIAPTGTISMIADCSSGIEPLFALSYAKHVMDDDRLVYVNEYLKAVVEHDPACQPWAKELLEYVDQQGSLVGCEVAPLWLQELFVTTHEVAVQQHVRMQAAFQQYTDNAVSKTINLPNSATVDEVADAYQLAYETGCKGITVFRDGCKGEQVMNRPSVQQVLTGPGNQEIAPRARPKRVQGYTEMVKTGHGNMYVTINLDEVGKPFEVFINQGKAGGCNAAHMEAIARLASLALRSGVPVEYVVEQLTGITCCPVYEEGMQVKSNPDGLALALSGFWTLDRPVKIEDSRQVMGKCPDCNGQLRSESNCLVCPDCGWSKC